MARQFNTGRGSEALFNDEHYDLFKAMKHINEMPGNTEIGPVPDVQSGDDIKNGALWLDMFSTESNADLKFYKNGMWNLLFKDRFKITGHLLEEEEPLAPIESQLWIDQDGIMRYYEKGEFRPIKATMADVGQVNPLGFDDFIIINQVDKAGSTVIDNFSQYLFANTPIVEWDRNADYVLHQGCVHGLNIYICRKAHTSDENIDIKNKKYWAKLDFLNQFIVPNANTIKMFINGNFIHQHMNMTVVENGNEIPDPDEFGWKKESDVCVSFPIDAIEGTYPNAVHVNPTRLHSVVKKFIAIDKKNPVIEVPEKNTEYYGMRGGIGRLLIKSNNEFKTDYISVTSKNIDCIKLSSKIAEEFDFVYTITYSFSDSKVKEPGKLYKRKFKLKDENYVWIDKVDPERIAVFAQGLYYEEDPANYRYDGATGYLYISENLQDYENMVKSFDFSVLYFPKIYRGKVNSIMYDDNNYFKGKGYRISLGKVPQSENMLGFLRGVQMHVGTEINYYPDTDPNAIYMPSLTRKFVDDTGEAYWCIVETDELDEANNVIHQFYRGKEVARNFDGEIGVQIYRSKEDAERYDGIYLAEDEMPIMFVDGVLVFQKEINVNSDYLTIYGLKEGQEVVVLADTNSTNENIDTEGGEIEFNSDRVLFEDSVSYATIPTEFNDSTIVYLKNGILSDASAVTTSVQPKSDGCHGEIRHWINYNIEKWMVFNGVTGKWEEISDEIMVPDVQGNEIPYVELLDRSSRGYTATRNSVSFLQSLGEDYCTYYAYKYSDSIENKLLFGYIQPNGSDGINNPKPSPGEPIQFRTTFKHYYTPGKNEMTVYLNGIRQNLLAPNDIGFMASKNRECEPHKNNELVLAFDDGTQKGKAIPFEEGYHVYHLIKQFGESRSVIRSNPLTDIEIREFEDQGYEVVYASKPTKNKIFYVIERCEGDETKACERKILTYKNALASKGAFSSNSYDTEDLVLTRGNIRVFVNGIRQPFGAYQTIASMEDHKRSMLQSYRILDSRTIQFQDPLIGGLGGNEGEENDPRFPIGDIVGTDGSRFTSYHEIIDEIVIEIRRDFKLREITIPIKDNTGIFGVQDGLPLDLFKTKDKVMIYINGLAYGKEYKIENDSIKLLNDDIRQLIGLNKTDVITFEWR